MTMPTFDARPSRIHHIHWRPRQESLQSPLLLIQAIRPLLLNCSATQLCSASGSAGSSGSW
jgi:hypothetical protein